MGRYQSFHSRFTRPAVLGATLIAGALAGPALAADHVHTCLSNPGGQDTATFVFHPRIIGVDGHEGDGDVFTDDFEHRFSYQLEVTEYDPAKPNWTGPTACNVKGGWGKDWDMPNVRLEFMTVDPSGIVYLENVPRNAKVHMSFFAIEDDDGEDDALDFDPAPGKGLLELDVFVDEMQARTMIGAREGRNDVTLNSAKRVVGDGSFHGGDQVRAFVEFVVNLHPNWTPGSGGTVGIGLVSPGQAVGPVTVTPGKMLLAVEPICRDYALKAVDFNVEAQKLSCGYQPPVWSNDHQMHFDWCMQGNNHTFASNELVKRAAALDQCAKQNAATTAGDLALCAVYATEASVSALKAQDWGCGFSGGRWSTDYAGHFGWCATGVPQSILLAEALSRATSLASCAP